VDEGTTLRASTKPLGEPIFWAETNKPAAQLADGNDVTTRGDKDYD
jgi:hypothetical protein